MYYNPTYCNCSIAEFLNWVKNNVSVLGMTCDYDNVTNCGKFDVAFVVVY